MNVLHVVTDTNRRGAQVHAVQLSQRLDERGWGSSVVALQDTRGGLEVEALGTGRVRPLRVLRQRMAAADITVAHGSSTLLACALAGAGGRRPFVYRQISDPVYWSSTLVRRARVTLYYRFPAHVVSLSPLTAETLRRRFGLRRDRITVIPSAVDERSFPPAGPEARHAARERLGADHDRRLVAYVGVISAEKGVGELLEAHQPEWQLVLAGDGPESSHFRGLAEAKGSSASFLGSTSATWDVYAAADVLALPSWSEQHPAVLIEAELVGTPVVATNVGAVADLVEDGVTGWLVPPHDVVALRAGLTEVLGDPAEAGRRSLAAERVARRRFTIEAVITDWESVLEQTIQRLRTARRLPW